METSPTLEDTLDLKEIASILDAANLHAQSVKVLFLDFSSERHTIQAWLEFSNFLDDLHILLEVKHDGYPLLPDEGAIEGGGTGTVRLVQYTASIGGGATNLTQEQFAAYQRAKLIADPRNGGNWQQAKEILEAAGFTVYWD